MSLIRGLLDRILLLVAFLAGSMVPGFIVQYQQRLGGRLDQVKHDLEPFQLIANAFHDGSLSNLVRHHLGSSDQTFYKEGSAIQSLVNAKMRLSEAYNGLNDTLFNQIIYLAGHPDKELFQATWADFTPSVSLSPDALLLAGGFALLVWLLFMSLWHLLARMFGVGAKQSKPMRMRKAKYPGQ